MRRAALSALTIAGLLIAGQLAAALRLPPAPVPVPVPVMQRVTVPEAPVPDRAGPEEYAQVLARARQFDWLGAGTVAHRFVDLEDGRDRTVYLRHILGTLADLKVDSAAALAGLRGWHALSAGVSLHNVMLLLKHQGTAGWRDLAPTVRLAYDRALTDLPEELDVHTVRAGLLVNLGQTAEAERTYTWPLDPDQVDGSESINVAYYHAARGDRAALLTWLRHAMRADPIATRRWARETDDLNAYRTDLEVWRILDSEDGAGWRQLGR